MTRSSHILRVLGMGMACVMGATGLAVAADGGPSVTAEASARTKVPVHCIRYAYYDPPICGLLYRGFRGTKGKRGDRGPVGNTGPVGAAGALGPIGPVGLTGPQGAVGDQGIQGIQGPPGAFEGRAPSDRTVLVTGTKVGPIFSAAGPMTGTELTPSVARCPVGGHATEAFDGGVTIQTTGSGNVVTLQSSYPGLYVNQTQVDPLPVGGENGAVSTQPANAYLAQAVITQLNTNEQVTVQAYVVCGP